MFLFMDIIIATRGFLTGLKDYALISSPLLGCDAMTVSGSPIEMVEVNAHTLSELIRLYLEERAEADMNHVR